MQLFVQWHELRDSNIWIAKRDEVEPYTIYAILGFLSRKGHVISFTIKKRRKIRVSNNRATQNNNADKVSLQTHEDKRAKNTREECKNLT